MMDVKFLLIVTISLFFEFTNAQVLKHTSEFSDIQIDSEITEVQPMTGIVLWTTSSHKNTDAISLEYAYMLFNEIVDANGDYDWQAVEDKLDDVASRNHQVIFRFRYVYPGYETSVPDYIKNLSDYNETEGQSEGRTTWFPDWTHSELMSFSLDFYTKFAERYDDDPRLAFVQVGFGLWAEYHIYDGPFILGETFPSKDFQTNFFEHLDTTFKQTHFSISIDAADDTYSPFSANEDLKNIHFGLFDDSFMHENHSGYNTSCWNFFDRDRYQHSPAGGEFSYYTTYDHQHVLDPTGNFGTSYEDFAANFHISYIIGNDQPNYQSIERIKEASMASGYSFKLASCKTSTDSSKIEVLNIGIAPIYYDAYITVNGVRAEESLKYLQPGETILYEIASGGSTPQITIECDRLVSGQEIQFEGTEDNTTSIKKNMILTDVEVFPSVLNRGEFLNVRVKDYPKNILNLDIYDISGKVIYSERVDSNHIMLNTNKFNNGLYILKLYNVENIYSTKKFIVK